MPRLGHDRGRAPPRPRATCKGARTPARHASDRARAPRGAARRITPAACLLGVLLVAAQAGPAEGAKGVEEVLADMRRHPADAGVQEEGCRALERLAGPGNADNRGKIAAAGGIADVLAAMRAHRSHAGVQWRGCGALGFLAEGNADNQGKIAAAGGIADVQAAMRAHWWHPLVQLFGFFALCNLDGSAALYAVARLLATGLAIWGCYRFLWRREPAGPPADPGRAQAPRVPADRVQPAANADAQADAQRITATARAEAQRITAAARADAQRITAAAHEAAQAAAAARGGASVAIFFRAELAAATGDFADARCIGSGGFGSVYHAPRLRGLGGGGLAIKKLDLASMQGQTEFLQEVQVLGACRHENLTPLLGFAADAGPVCLVTPLMRGGSLADRLTLDGPARARLSKLPGAPAGGFAPLSWRQRLAVAVDVVRGLLFLHTPDADTHKPAILHRDVKPNNILLDLDDHARLADMGLARAQRPEAAHLTTATSIAGTNGYLDEYYQNTGRFDERADAYAVGVTLLVLLTGRPAVDPMRGHIIGQCDVEDRARDVPRLSDTTARFPSAVAVEVHAVGMDLVMRSRDRRITLSAALLRLQQLVDAHPAPASAPENLVERDCMVCLSAPRHVRFGCGHSALCRGCSGLFMQRARPVCLICRQRVTQETLIVSDAVALEDTFVRPVRA